MIESLSRRGLLVGGASAIASTTLATPFKLANLGRRSLRVAHLTDFHIQPELRATEGSRAAFEHAMKFRPDLILSGGDHIMDSFAQTETRTRLQWDLFDNLRKDHTDVRFEPAIGNHDVWGWNKKASQTDGSERLWGKRWFAEFFHRERTYTSFDFGNWHFVILDNVFLTPDGYNGFVEAEQVEWLKDDLSKSVRPTLVLSHIPLFSVTSFANSFDLKTGDWTVGGNLMTKNLAELQAIFRRNRQVKLCLSGHTHCQDRVDYEGVTYLCDGAVSGNWWKGPIGLFNPGYRILNLHDDGTFEASFHDWGWTEG